LRWLGFVCVVFSWELFREKKKQGKKNKNYV